MKLSEMLEIFLLNQQSDFDKKGAADNVFDGGVGYGSRWAHSDLSNTTWQWKPYFMPRRHLSRRKVKTWTSIGMRLFPLCPSARISPQTNKEEWVSGHKDDRGGFVYFPGSSMAGERDNQSGSKALRSYGSMSYAGLLSFIYAEMDKDDPRLIAVQDWLNANYSKKIQGWDNKVYFTIIIPWRRHLVYPV